MALIQKKDVGCWIDGSFGMSHVMQKLAMFCIVAFEGPPADELKVLGSGSPDRLSDDHSELDWGTEILQRHCDPGLVFIWEAGDLILTTEEEVDVL